MADINERKTPEEIKRKILEALNDKPLNALEISKAINSNWSTVKSHIDELIQIGKVKEIKATDKGGYYQKITGDTYYNIPISEEQREQFKFLFNLIIQEYKKANRLPKKTELAKDSVDAINQLNLKLPTAWYIYGQIPIMIPDPTKEYLTDYVPKNAIEIQKVVSNIVKDHDKILIRELKHAHYAKYDNSFYLMKEELLKEVDSMKNEKEIMLLFTQFYIKCPISKFPETFDLTERLFAVTKKLQILGILKAHKVEVMLSLETLWKFIASYTLLDSISQNPQYKREELVQFNLGPAIETKKYCAEEVISNLESVYLSELPNKEIDISDDAKEVREIMSDWDGG